MDSMTLDTPRLTLVLDSPAEMQAMIEAMEPEMRAQVSDEWIEMVCGATSPDPWIHGFRMVERATGDVVGQCAFKGPPSSAGAVEIAYAVEPEHQGKGFAKESAEALVEFALNQEEVKLVLAHTLPETNASTSVLASCGFQRAGEVIDPEDGPVWRWEKQA